MQAYFDCFSGVAGDMIIGAMVDAGLPLNHLKKELKNLPIKNYEIKSAIEKRGVIGGVNFQVIIKKHHHESGHSHSHYADIIKMIKKSSLSKKVQEVSCNIFETLGKAEAFVHRTTIDHVHFHEVGAVDSIIDIVGAAIGFDYFDFKEIHASPLPITRGFVDCEHGKMPVPAPATLEIIKNVPIVSSPVMAEVVTPTGAAVLKTVVKHFSACPLNEINKTGYGLGDKDFKEIPNALRLLIGKGERLIVIEANIDDMNPQIYGYLIEKLINAGAIDVTIQPVIMKKRRAGAKLQILCNETDRHKLIKIILTETTTFGVRFHPVEREILERKFDTLSTKFGEIKIKLGFLDGLQIKAVPEYEDCAKNRARKEYPVVRGLQRVSEKIKIEKLVYGGAGVGFLNRMPVFVYLTVPGDEVECKITKQSKNYAEADLIKILKPSPNRTTPKCEHFGRCGGCQWQHIDYASQILWKQIILEEQLKRIGKIKDANVLPTIPSPKIWNYRSRIKLQKNDTGAKGFYAAGSHNLIEINDCLIAEPKAKDTITNLGFTQVNPAQNENLKKLVASLVKDFKPKSVLELYCGNGNLTFPIKGLANEILASDSDKKSIQWAQKEMLAKKIKNIEFVNMSAKATLNTHIKNGRHADILLLDPPRDGCKDILTGILKVKPRAIIYVSCNPSTLARDLAELIKGGYKLTSSQPIDMFPQTYHIESVTVLCS